MKKLIRTITDRMFSALVKRMLENSTVQGLIINKLEDAMDTRQFNRMLTKLAEDAMEEALPTERDMQRMVEDAVKDTLGEEELVGQADFDKYISDMDERLDDLEREEQSIRSIRERLDDLEEDELLNGRLRTLDAFITLNDMVADLYDSIKEIEKKHQNA